MTKQLTPSEQLAHSTVRISCSTSGGEATGTGFFFRCLDDGGRHVPVIVTNKHVIAGATTGRFSLTLLEDGGPAIGKHFVIEIDNFESQWLLHPEVGVDLCAMPMGPLLNQAASAGHKFFYVALDKNLIPSSEELEDLGAVEDILMVGYPNGIWDAANNMPIVRRGVTATHPDLNYEGRVEFMIDAACFPGSSGSPVFLYNSGGYARRDGGMVMGGVRVKLLGVLYAGPQHTATGEIRVVNVPTQQRAIAISAIPQNLGLVIKSSRLADFDNLLRPLVSKGAV